MRPCCFITTHGSVFFSLRVPQNVSCWNPQTLIQKLERRVYSYEIHTVVFNQFRINLPNFITIRSIKCKLPKLCVGQSVSMQLWSVSMNITAHSTCMMHFILTISQPHFSFEVTQTSPEYPFQWIQNMQNITWIMHAGVIMYHYMAWK